MTKQSSKWVDSVAAANEAVMAGDGAGGASFKNHELLRQLIHFIDDGPAEDTGTGLRQATTGTTFPTAVTWYHTVSAVEYKLVEKLIGWTGVLPTTITWKIYNDAGSLLLTVTDTITYSGIFETGRTRTAV